MESKQKNSKEQKDTKDIKLIAIILISLLVIGIIVFTNFFSLYNTQNIIINQLIDHQVTKTEHAAHQIQSHVLRVRDDLVTLSKFPLMETLDINKCSGDMRIIHEGIEGKIDSLLRVDKEGNIIECSSDKFNDYVGLNIKNKEYFKIPKKTKEPYIAINTKQGDHNQIIIATPLFKSENYTPYPNFENEFQGVLLSIIELEQLFNLYIHPVIGPDNGYYAIINTKSNETLSKSEGIENIIQFQSLLKNNKVKQVKKIDSLGKVLITTSPIIIGNERWDLIIITPVKNFEVEMNSVQRRHIISLIIIIVIFSFLSYVLISTYISKKDIEKRLDKTSSTLEKLGIKIETETDKYEQADIYLESRKTYLIKEDDENHAFELFINSLNRGYAGLGIVRENPDEIKKKYNLSKTPFIWLSTTQKDNIISETDINRITRLIIEFISKSRKSVILIERFDVLFIHNNQQEVIKGLQELKDIVSSRDAILIISLNPDLMDPVILKQIETETIDLFGKDLRKKTELSKLEMDILRYINDKNITNELVSYKDITKKFNITKPTTRVKLNRLQDLKLINITQNGRTKSIKITSAGRKII